MGDLTLVHRIDSAPLRHDVPGAEIVGGRLQIGKRELSESRHTSIDDRILLVILCCLFRLRLARSDTAADTAFDFVQVDIFRARKAATHFPLPPKDPISVEESEREIAGKGWWSEELWGKPERTERRKEKKTTRERTQEVINFCKYVSEILGPQD